jgi:hypothetical protein
MAGSGHKVRRDAIGKPGQLIDRGGAVADPAQRLLGDVGEKRRADQRQLLPEVGFAEPAQASPTVLQWTARQPSTGRVVDVSQHAVTELHLKVRNVLSEKILRFTGDQRGGSGFACDGNSQCQQHGQLRVGGSEWGTDRAQDLRIDDGRVVQVAQVQTCSDSPDDVTDLGGMALELAVAVGEAGTEGPADGQDLCRRAPTAGSTSTVAGMVARR